MGVEVTHLEPVSDKGGLVFVANVKIGGIVILGWRGTRDHGGGIRVGPPVRSYWEHGERYTVPVVQLPPALMDEAIAAVRAAWESRERGTMGDGNGRPTSNLRP